MTRIADATGAPPAGRSSASIWVLVLGVLAILAAIAALLVPRNQTASRYATAQPGDVPALGPASVKVTISEFGDFNDAACRAWYKEGVLQKLLDTYGDKIRFEWRDLPTRTVRSPYLAEAGQCAQAQGKFWDYHDVLLENQGTNGGPELIEFARQVGMNTTDFVNCLQSGAKKDVVRRSQLFAMRLGVPGPSTFTINGVTVGNVPTFESLKRLIDRYFEE